ncbi:MAG TPA: IS1 family transposase [Pedobacter sp.]
MQQCPFCQQSEKQIKSGKNRCGSQRFLCQECGRTYTPEPKPQGYAEEVREKAVRMYVEGINFRRIGRLLAVNHQSVVNWVNLYHSKISGKAQEKATQTTAETVEMDELWTFIGAKKTKPTL